MQFNDPQKAFTHAIQVKILFDNPVSANYAGKYMYMFTDSNGDNFKNIDTRKYIVVK